MMQDTTPIEASHQVRDACLCLHVRRAARTLTRRYDEALHPLGINNGQFSLMITISRPKAPTIGAVAALLAMDRATLTANLKPLERRGMVEVVVDPNDKRSRLLTLTATGQALLARAIPLWERIQGSIESQVVGSDPDRLRHDLCALT